jgi:hypothetical protein
MSYTNGSGLGGHLTKLFNLILCYPAFLLIQMEDWPMAEDSPTRAKILKLAQNRARNSVIALHHQHDHAIHEGRVRADRIWGAQQQELAAQLPEGDSVRGVIEFIGELDALSPPPHLTPRYPKR